MQIKERLRNKYFVTSLISFILLVGKVFNLFEVPADFDVLVKAFLGILTGAGIILDPLTPGFKDNIDM